jgi:putative ATPase
MKKIGYGMDYKYAHDYEQNFIAQEFLPDILSSIKFYEPQSNNREKEMRARLKALWNAKYGY